MDDKDDDKKRVLTPPSEWAEGMKPTASSEGEEIDESTDWLEDDDFEVPPTSEVSTEDESSALEQPSTMEAPSADEASELAQPGPSDADAILTDHGKAGTGKTTGGSKLPWAVAIVGVVLAGGMGGLWLDTQETTAAEVAKLKDTIRSIKRSDNKQAPPNSNLLADNEALQRQIDALQKENAALTGENEALKKREAERAQRAIEKSTKPQTAKSVSAPISPPSSSAKERGSETTTALPNQVGGSWFVNLESHKTRSVADERIALLRKKVRGVNLSIASASVNGQTYYRVRAAGFASKVDATAASQVIAQALKAGPFWVGKDSEKIAQRPSAKATPTKQQVAKQLRTEPLKPPTPATAPKQPVRLRSLPMRDNWFVFVDTYDSGQRADQVISTLNGQGMDAKVAVESRSGELFYRVQIVGIESEAIGNTIVSQLRADEFKNARLRKTVN